MRRQQKGGRGVHGARTHARPWWETDKSKIGPPTGGADVGGVGKGSVTTAATAAGAVGDAGTSGGGSSALGAGGATSASGATSAPRSQQSPAERRPDDRYSHKVRGADQAAPDSRRHQIGRTPPPTNPRSAGLQRQAFSPSRVQNPIGTPEVDETKRPGTREVVKQNSRQHTARPNPAAVYGFAGWLGTSVAFLLYLLWAYLPVEILHNLGVTYYPSRYWAVAIPAYVCVVVVFIFTTYSGFCLMINPPVDAFTTFTDKHALDKPKDWDVNRADDARLPPIFDIPIAEVNRLLYQRTRTPEQQTGHKF